MESETAHIWKKINNFTFGFFLFVGDEVKTNDFKYFDISVSAKKLYFGYCNLFIREDLLERN